MSGMAAAGLKPDPQPITACTVSRDVQNFDLLIEDMEACLGENWGDLGFTDALAFLEQPEAEDLEFIAIAFDDEDESDTSLLCDIIRAAKARGIKVLLIAEDVSPATLHQLLREGGDEFVPYPLPEGELAEAVARVTAPVPDEPDVPEEHRNRLKATGDRKMGVVLSVSGHGRRRRGEHLLPVTWALGNLPRNPTKKKSTTRPGSA